MSLSSPDMDDPGVATNPVDVSDAVGTTQLKQGAIDPRRALFYALSALALPVLIAVQGATMIYSSGWSSWLAMLLGTLVAGALAVIIARFSRRHLATGSLMSYANLEAGQRTGALVGGALIVGYTCMLAVFMQSVLVYFVSFVRDLGGPEITNAYAQVAIAAAFLAVGVVLAQRGVSLSVNAAVILAWVGAPLAIVLVAAAVFHQGVDLIPQVKLQDFSMSLFLPGVVLAFSVFAGFEGFTALAMETANPRRTIPPILKIVVIAGGLVSVVGVVLTVPIMLANIDALNEGRSPLAILADAGQVSFLSSVADAFTLLTAMGALIVFINDSARIVGTAAKDGLLPRPLGKIDEKRQTPARATVSICSAATCMLIVFLIVIDRPLFSTFVDIFTMVSYSWLIAYVVIAIVGIVDAVRKRDVFFGAISVLALLGTGFIVAYSVAQAEGSAASLVWVVIAAITALWIGGLVARRMRRPTAVDQLI